MLDIDDTVIVSPARRSLRRDCLGCPTVFIGEVLGLALRVRTAKHDIRSVKFWVVEDSHIPVVVVFTSDMN